MENFDMQQTSNKFVFQKERDFGEIISDTFTFFSKNYKALSAIFLKFIGPFLLLTVVANTMYQYKTGDLFSDIQLMATNPDAIILAFTENFIILAFFLVTTLVLSVIIYGTVLHTIKSYIQNDGEIKDLDISNGLKKDFLNLVGYFILAGIATGIGILFCILPGVYLSVVFTPGVVLIIMKNETIIDALTNSFKLIKDNWWITFATVLVFGILIGVLNFVFQIPTFIYTLIEGLTAADSFQNDVSDLSGMYQNWVFLLFTAIAVIGQYFLSIFTVIMISLVYFNLAEKADHTGTINEIDQIGSPS